METKKQIRKRMLQHRDALAEDERYRLSDMIAEKLYTKDIYRNAKTILLFASYKSEVDTFGIFRQAIYDGKHVFFPRCTGKEMSFYEVTSASELSEGYMGILEPEPSVEKLFTDFEDENVLMIMPGAVFDMECNRIGYGGGFYDRFLAGGYAGKTVAIGYDCQLLRDNKIPAEDTDVKPDYILTDCCMIASNS